MAKQQTETENLPAVLDFSIDSGKGFDTVEASDFGVPILKVLQKMSPAVDEIEEAKEGDFYIGQLGRVFSGSEGLRIIPSYYKKLWAIWTPRDMGGGYQGELAYDDPIVKEAKQVGMKKVLDNGDELVETVNWYLTILEESMPLRVLLPMTSTQLRVSRKFISLSAGIKMKNPNGELYTPPMFSHTYKLTTQRESNNKGSWYSMNLTLEGPIQDSITYEQTKEFYDVARNLGGQSPMLEA
jgi:hypothetical protein